LVLAEIGQLKGGAKRIGGAGAGHGVYVVIGCASCGGDSFAVVEEELDAFPESGNVSSALE